METLYYKVKKMMAQRAQRLKNLNIVAGVLHLVNFIVSLVLVILYHPQSFKGNLTVDFGLILKPLGSYPLVWVDLPFSLITALFHLWIAFNSKQYRTYVFVRGYNPYRWQEYSITASFMTFVIMQVAGVSNIITLLVVGVVGNVLLQFQGYQMDLSNPPNRTKTTWMPTLLGWLLFCGQWALIWSYFFSLPARSWVVYTVVIGNFITFCVFGLIQLLHYARVWKDPYTIEIAYMFMSYTAKFYLNWNLIIHMVIQ